MTRRLASLSLVALLAACASGTPATAPPATSTTAAPTTATAAATAGAATTAPAAPGTVTPPPAGGAAAVRVTLKGGADAGTYTGTENPNCSKGIVGTGIWGIQYSIMEAGAKEFSSLQMVLKPEGEEDEGMFPGTRFLMTVTIGPIGQGRDYEVQVSTREGETKGQGNAEVEDRGQTATITLTGTTADGVDIAATVDCPSVVRA